MSNRWEITERLSNEALHAKCQEIKESFIYKGYKHTNGTVYMIIDVVTINKDGKSYWGFEYINDDTVNQVKHTGPIHEFLDGRFEEVK